MKSSLLRVAVAAAVFGFTSSAAFAAESIMHGFAAHETALRASDTVTGHLPSNTPIHIAVALKLRNRDQLDQFIATAHGKAMAPGQLAKDHLPAPGQAQAVSNFLRQSGFTNIQIADNRLLITADGTADAAEKTFATTLEQVQTADGRTAYANRGNIEIPHGFADTILSVIGLQTVYQPRTMLQRASGFGPSVSAGLSTFAVTGHNPTEFASIYGGSGQTTGAGVTVGIITQGSLTNVLSDLSKFTTNNGLPAVTTQTVQTGSTSTDTSGDGEWDLDSQDIVGMAGGQVGKIIFYNIPTLANTNLTSDINTVVSRNETKIINVSLGECETSAQGDGSAAAQDQSFATAVAQGQTFSISTGDSGSDECSNGGTTPSWPAASQYVMAVAGTTLNASTTAWSSETVWSGSGGSQSTFEPKPSWQTLWTGARRGVADVAFDADPNSGSKVIVDGASQQIGGTSLAAPLFSGLWTRVIAAKGTTVGFAGPLVYQLTSSAFHDVTSGSNGTSCCTAAAGYDLASGRGSMIISTTLANIGGGGGGTGGTPTASFSFTTNGLTANFTDTSTDSGGTIGTHSWNFGDSATSTATSPSHTYAAAGTYTVTETVKDSVDATHTSTATHSVTVTAPTGSVLQNGVGVTISDSTVNHQQNWTMTVPAGATNLVFSMSGGTGDPDLYVKFGSAPTLTSYDCRPYVSGPAETCTMSPVQAGTYYVMVNTYAAYSGTTLKGSYTAPGSGGTPTANFTFTTSGLTANFTDTSTDAGGTIGTHSWSFGDGGSSTSASPSHAYAASGTYTVTETVADSVNTSATSTKTASVTVTAPSGSTQLLGNTGFETGTAAPWTTTAGVVDNSASEAAHAGSWKAWMNGYGSAHTDTVSQAVTIPAGKTTGTLQFYLHVDTAETTTTSAYDKLTVTVGSTTVATFSNLNAAAGYVVHSYNVPVTAGASVTVKFNGVEDGSLQTSFVVDDVTFTVQ